MKKQKKEYNISHEKYNKLKEQSKEAEYYFRESSK